jgi:hypothetical protein
MCSDASRLQEHPGAYDRRVSILSFTPFIPPDSLHLPHGECQGEVPGPRREAAHGPRLHLVGQRERERERERERAAAAPGQLQPLGPKPALDRPASGYGPARASQPGPQPLAGTGRGHGSTWPGRFSCEPWPFLCDPRAVIGPWPGPVPGATAGQGRGRPAEPASPGRGDAVGWRGSGRAGGPVELLLSRSRLLQQTSTARCVRPEVNVHVLVVHVRFRVSSPARCLPCSAGRVRGVQHPVYRCSFQGNTAPSKVIRHQFVSESQ